MFRLLVKQWQNWVRPSCDETKDTGINHSQERESTQWFGDPWIQLCHYCCLPQFCILSHASPVTKVSTYVRLSPPSSRPCAKWLFLRWKIKWTPCLFKMSHCAHTSHWESSDAAKREGPAPVTPVWTVGGASWQRPSQDRRIDCPFGVCHPLSYFHLTTQCLAAHHCHTVSVDKKLNGPMLAGHSCRVKCAPVAIIPSLSIGS